MRQTVDHIVEQSVQPLIHRHPAACPAELDGEVCLFQPETAEYLNLNSTGSAIWNLLETPADLDGLVVQLLQLYQVDEADCRQDTETFLAAALERGILLEQPQQA